MSGNSKSSSGGDGTGAGVGAGSAAVADGVPTPQPNLPLGTKKVVIFDTNAYRRLGRHKVQSLRQREIECNVCALAHPVVMLELAAHLADENDPHYSPCMSAMTALAEHTLSPTGSGGLSLCAEPRSEVCHQLFQSVRAEDEQLVKDLSMLPRYVRQYAPDITDPDVIEKFRKCADQVMRLEAQWKESMKRLLRQPPDLQRWQDFLAIRTVDECARMAGRRLGIYETYRKMSVIQNVYPTPFRMMSILLQMLASASPDSIDNHKKKWGNYLWDYLICFSVGSSHSIEDAKVFLVTGDHDIEKASIAAECGDRVISLQDHMNSVGLSL
ncbi:MAG: hypothetical protein HZA88_04745 [Verrucomicrobia bacterium]|nr:hypothetical protein [Verrucomicrobiota bacterium]